MKEAGKMTLGAHPAPDEADMHSRAALLIFFLATAFHSTAAASPFSEAAARLDGDWRGSDFVLRIDARRAQASIDPTRPFEWKHFVVKEVTSEDIVFAVGAELFEAKLADDVLTLTSTEFRGERVLVREAELRGSTSE
jgi:hypothetical protein